MVHLFEDTNLCAIHAKRVTISKDSPPSSQVVEELPHENIFNAEPQVLHLLPSRCDSGLIQTLLFTPGQDMSSMSPSCCFSAVSFLLGMHKDARVNMITAVALLPAVA